MSDKIDVPYGHTNNPEVLDAVEKIDGYLEQLNLCQSRAPLGFYHPAEKARHTYYIDDFSDTLEAAREEPLPDVPGTWPDTVSFPDPPTMDDSVKSSYVRRVFREWLRVRGELVASQSRVLGGSVLPHDARRLTQMADRIRRYYQKVVKTNEDLDDDQKADYLDLPESVDFDADNDDAPSYTGSVAPPAPNPAV